MAKEQKINGSFKGNKLNISITSSSQNSSNNVIQPIESTGKKIASIAEQTNTNLSAAKKNPALNKKVTKKDAVITNNIQEVEILKEISQKLSVLNNSIISIQTEKKIVNEDQNNVNIKEKKLDEEIFTSNFSESVKNSFMSLLNDSSFKMKANSILNDIFSTSVLLKQSDLDDFSQNISTIISENSYTIPSSEKAIDQTVQMQQTADLMTPTNDAIK